MAPITRGSKHSSQQAVSATIPSATCSTTSCTCPRVHPPASCPPTPVSQLSRILARWSCTQMCASGGWVDHRQLSAHSAPPGSPGSRWLCCSHFVGLWWSLELPPLSRTTHLRHAAAPRGPARHPSSLRPHLAKHRVRLVLRVPHPKQARQVHHLPGRRVEREGLAGSGWGPQWFGRAAALQEGPHRDYARTQGSNAQGSSRPTRLPVTDCLPPAEHPHLSAHPAAPAQSARPPSGPATAHPWRCSAPPAPRAGAAPPAARPQPAPAACHAGPEARGSGLQRVRAGCPAHGWPAA